MQVLDGDRILCLVVKLSKQERKDASKPWRQSMIENGGSSFLEDSSHEAIAVC